MSSQPNPFTQFLKRQAGDTLRLVVEFTDEGYTAEYAREDVAQKYSNREFDSIIDDARKYASLAHSEAVIESAEGLYCQVVCFEDIVTLVFPRDHEDTLVTLDPTAAQNLHNFASACENFLQE